MSGCRFTTARAVSFGLTVKLNGKYKDPYMQQPLPQIYWHAHPPSPYPPKNSKYLGIRQQLNINSLCRKT